ncbi:paraquat-inducible protein A [Endozoicomonas sp. OPT23]|uniref:PqiA/YebS family transporter subunit n=1 Tax=Endozoicomonas sp. OPT23 TaxID=2072845 RepID=UPI001DBD903B|nr:paraquat-inducible protein A [Endozoicomonas sp. OPT23]
MLSDRETAPLIACEECGIVVEVPVVEPGQKAVCPRCRHTLTKVSYNQFHTMMACVIASLIMLVLSLSFSFLSFSVQGLSQQIKLLHAAEILSLNQNALLGSLLFITVVVLPAIYLSTLGYLYGKAAQSAKSGLKKRALHRCIIMCRWLFFIQPWLMVDVFLVGVLVSLIKIASLADVALGSSFWAFCAFAILMVKCLSMVDRFWLWNQFLQCRNITGVAAGDCHESENHLACHTCHQLNPVPAAEHQALCLRCGKKLHPFHPSDNLQRSWALLIASVILYIPANLYPMMYTVSLGQSQGSTIMEGVILLWHLGSYPVAIVVFTASVLIPLAKMMALAWLFSHAGKEVEVSGSQRQSRLKIYRITEFIGRWSMIDIFVVAILVALVQLQNVMAIYPGPAALSFAGVVILTMLSAITFDSRLLWQTRFDSTPYKYPESDV